MTDIIPIHYCAFCGKNNNDPGVDTLVIAYKASITGICNICIDWCNAIISERQAAMVEGGLADAKKGRSCFQERPF